jgi:hypothetical protein
MCLESIAIFRTQVMTLNLIQDLGLQSKSRILHWNESLRPQDYVSNYGDSKVLHYYRKE